MVADFVFRAYLVQRQFRVTLAEKAPKVVRKEVASELFIKSQRYARDKLKLDLARSVITLLEELAILHFDLMPQIWDVSGVFLSLISKVGYLHGLSGSEALQSVLFIVIKKTISKILEIPIDYVHTFVLEEKWEFNRMTKSKFYRDLVLSLVISDLIYALAVFVFVKIVRFFGASFLIYTIVTVVIGFLLFQTIIPIVILPLFHKLTPLEEGELKTAIEDLAKRNGFPTSRLLVIDGSTTSTHANAFFLGLPWNKQIVLYDTLIQKFPTSEIIAVLAHELGHWKLGHVLQVNIHIWLILAINFAFFSAFFDNSSLVKAFGFANPSPAINFVLFTYLTWPLDTFNSISRNFMVRRNEFQADNYAKEQGYKDEIASGLIRLNSESLDALYTDWLYSICNSSHPSLVERLVAIGYQPKQKVRKRGLEVTKEEDEKGDIEEREIL